MKLIIQIPCYNEAESLPITLSKLPRKVNGFNSVEWLVINDGSSDGTEDIAKRLGVDHIVSFKKNKGLAKAFSAGLDECVRFGADVIVNTDADNQYDAGCIPDLVKPILEGRADIVVGSRPINNIKHFSILKKIFQKIGSWAVRIASNTSVSDAPSGFRAISREAAVQLNFFGKYTYTIETLIQAGVKDLVVESVPINVNEYLRPSRLVKNSLGYIKKSIYSIVRIFILYSPFKTFFVIGFILLASGTVLGIRFLFYYFAGSGQGHIQSLILTSILIIMGVQTILMAFLADIISVNRIMIESIQNKLKKNDDNLK